MAPFDLARQQRCGLITQTQVGDKDRLHVLLCVRRSAACFCSARCDDGLSIAEKVVRESKHAGMAPPQPPLYVKLLCCQPANAND